MTPVARSAPPAAETSVAPALDTTLAACEGKPLYLWRSPGKYGYSRTGDDGSVTSLPIEQNPAGDRFRRSPMSRDERVGVRPTEFR